MDTDENIAIIKQLIKEPIIEIIKEKHKNANSARTVRLF